MDAIVARLEGLVARVAGGGGDDNESPAAVTDYDSFYKESVQPFVDACNCFEETKKLGTWTETAFKQTRNIIEASTQCKKPSDAAMMTFLGPIVKVITDAQEQDNRSPFFNQHKSYGEAIQCLNFLLADSSKAIIVGQLDSADFYLTKTLTMAKDKEEPDKTNMRKYVSGLKKMLSDLAEYCVMYHKLGLTWKVSGTDLKEYTPGQKAAGGKPSSLEGRLEAACDALETHAAKSAGGEDGPQCVVAYQEFYSASVQPLVDACNKFPEMKKLSDWTEQAFKHLETVLLATTQCKKPSQEAFMGFLGPIVKVITDAGNPDRKGAFFNHETCFFELVQALNFVCMEGSPKAYILGQIDSGAMYSNKILMAAKDKEDPEKTNQRAFVKAIKELLTGLADYANEYTKMGLVWKVKDAIDIKDFKA